MTAVGCVFPAAPSGNGRTLFSGDSVDDAAPKDQNPGEQAAEEKTPDSLVIPAPSDGQLPPTTPAEWIGRTAPDFVLLDSKGERHQLSEQKSDIVVLEWSSIVCSFVNRHYSRVSLQATSRSYQGKGVTWFGIDSSFYPIAHPIKVEKWVADRRVPHPVLLDPEGIVGEAFGVTVTPTIVILKGGKVAFFGAIDDDIWGRKSDSRSFLIEALDLLLAGEPVAETTPVPYGTSVAYLSVETARRAAREKARQEREAEAAAGSSPKTPR